MFPFEAYRSLFEGGERTVFDPGLQLVLLTRIAHQTYNDKRSQRIYFAVICLKIAKGH